MNITRKRLWIVAIAIVVLLLLFMWIRSAKNSDKNTHTQTAIAVKTASITKANWQTPVNAIGTVDNNQNAAVAAETDGRITAMTFQPGSTVQQGTTLFSLFNKNLRAQLHSAKANLIAAKQNFIRTTHLHKAGYATTAELDTAKQTYESDLGERNRDKALLSQTIIRAPVTGKVGLNTKNIGDFVTSGTILTNISPDAPLRIDFSIPGKYSNSVYPGKDIFLTAQGSPEQQTTTTVFATNPIVDRQSRHLMVRANLPPTLQRLPGQYENVLIYVGKKQPVFVVPETAVHYQFGGAFIYVARNSQAIEIPVHVIQIRAKTVGVQGDLHLADKVISVSPPNLQQHSKIEVVQ